MALVFFSFLMGLGGAWLVMRYKDRIGTMDVPTARSSHEKEIPKGAGLGILAALVAAGLGMKIPFFIWIPAMGISLASFMGADRHILPVLHRLGIHFGCALFFLVFFLHANGAGPGAYVRWLPVLVFIVGTANFYNFMDGIDGIAGITGFLAFLLMAVFARHSGAAPDLVFFSLAVAFACLGFLCFNFPVAKVFLGDVGSILLGFVFACLVIFLSQDLADFLVMAGFLALFYFDEMVTMAVRIKNGDSLVEPHRKHVYQVLVNEAGIGHWQVSAGYGAAQLLVGGFAMWLHPGGAWPLLAMYLFFGLIFVGFSIVVRKRFPSSEN